MHIQVKPLSTHWPITTVLDTLCTILLSCESSQISTIKQWDGVLKGDQYLACLIFAYQTTLLVSRILLLIVGRDTPSPQGILYLVLTVHSMLEAPNSLQQISKYSMKQPLKELYPELLTLCFSLLLFVCLWRYDYLSSSASFDPVSPLLLLPIISHGALISPLGDHAFFFHLRVSVGR